MTEPRKSVWKLASTLVVIGLGVGALIATGCLWWLGDWENSAWGLTLSLRILWGVWTLIAVGVLLTHVTIFGWSFRRYFRLDEHAPAGPPRQRRATTAPWLKSPAASFSITVVLVSLTGVTAIGMAVMWILEPVTGPWVFWVVITILGITWWVSVLATVLTRIAIFGFHKQKVMLEVQQQQGKSLLPTTGPTTEAKT
jgi:hypothetical protein